MVVTAGDRPAIEARGLAKRYGKLQAVAGIDLVVRRGEVFGFLGPNGAGKTTTLRILSTLTRPDGGTARVLGHDVIAEADADPRLRPCSRALWARRPTSTPIPLPCPCCYPPRGRRPTWGRWSATR